MQLLHVLGATCVSTHTAALPNLFSNLYHYHAQTGQICTAAWTGSMFASNSAPASCTVVSLYVPKHPAHPASERLPQTTLNAAGHSTVNIHTATNSFPLNTMQHRSCWLPGYALLAPRC